MYGACWTKEEDDTLASCRAQDMSVEQISERMSHRTADAVKHRLSRLNLPGLSKNRKRHRRNSEAAAKHDEEITRRWAEGWTASQIGASIGKTKNAVIGRAHRIGLPARESPIGRYKGPTSSVDGCPKPRSRPKPKPSAQTARAGAKELREAWAKQSSNAASVCASVRTEAVQEPKRHSEPVEPLFSELSEDTCWRCMWVIDFDKPTQRYCDDPAYARGKSWCKKHAALVFTKVAA